MNRLLKSLGIEHGEGTRVLLLFVQSLFLGVFLASYDIGASTLFLKRFPDSMLGTAFLVSGVIGMTLSLLYARLQKSLSFRTLAIINLMLVVVMTTLLRIGFTVTDAPWLTFLTFILWGPMNAIALLGFWGAAGRLFTIRQGKRLFGLIDGGSILGTIAISFMVPLLLRVLPATRDLLWVSAVSAATALLMQFLLTAKYGKRLAEREGDADDGKAKSAGLGLFFRNKYILFLSLFVVFSMVGAFLLYNTFLVVVKESYPEERSLAEFLGFFTAAVMIVSFLIKTFLYGKLANTYGLKVLLLILPIVIGLFVLFSALSGTFMGSTPEVGSNFVIFFLMIALSRLFNHSLSLSMEAPTLKILFQPLDAGIRYDVQAKVEGTVNEMSGIVAGGLIMGLSAISGFAHIHFVYILLAVLGGWAFVIVRLHREYRNSLRSSLDSMQASGPTLAVIKDHLPSPWDADWESEDPARVEAALRWSALGNSVVHVQQALRALASQNPVLQEIGVTALEKGQFIEAIDPLGEAIERQTEATLRTRMNSLRDGLAEELKTSLSSRKAVALARSRKPEDRQHLARIIGSTGDIDHAPALAELLRDLHPDVRHEAIRQAARMRHPDFIAPLVDNLEPEVYRAPSASALLAYGPRVVEALEGQFYKSSLSSDALATMAETLGRIGGERVVERLLRLTTFPDYQVSQSAFRALRMSGYQADAERLPRLLQEVERRIGVAAWDLAAVHELDGEGDDPLLRRAQDRQYLRSRERVYHALMLCYEAGSVDRIRENIESGSAESVGYAIELLDLFVADELKPKLFPLFEDLNTNDKLKQLQVNFPREKYEGVDLYKALLNHDYNLAGRFVKLLALYRYGQTQGAVVGQDLLACLFHPDLEMRRTAAWAIGRLDRTAFDRVAPRLNPEHREELKSIVKSATETPDLAIVTARQLAGWPAFHSLPPDILVELAEAATLHTQGAGEPYQPGHEVAVFALASGRLAQGDERFEEGYLVVTKADGALWRVEEQAQVLEWSERELAQLIHRHDSLSRWLAERSWAPLPTSAEVVEELSE